MTYYCNLENEQVAQNCSVLHILSALQPLCLFYGATKLGPLYALVMSLLFHFVKLYCNRLVSLWFKEIMFFLYRGPLRLSTNFSQ